MPLIHLQRDEDSAECEAADGPDETSPISAAEVTPEITGVTCPACITGHGAFCAATYSEHA